MIYKTKKRKKKKKITTATNKDTIDRDFTVYFKWGDKRSRPLASGPLAKLRSILSGKWRDRLKIARSRSIIEGS